MRSDIFMKGSISFAGKTIRSDEIATIETKGTLISIIIGVLGFILIVFSVLLMLYAFASHDSLSRKLFLDIIAVCIFGVVIDNIGKIAGKYSTKIVITLKNGKKYKSSPRSKVSANRMVNTIKEDIGW